MEGQDSPLFEQDTTLISFYKIFEFTRWKKPSNESSIKMRLDSQAESGRVLINNMY